MRNALLIALLFLVPAGLFAQSVEIQGPFSFGGTVLTSFNSPVDYGPFRTGKASSVGFQWNVVPASGNPSINVVVLQCNTETGTYAAWPTALDGTTPSTDVTITSANGGSALKISRSEFVKFRVVNTATVNGTPTFTGFAR